MTAERHIGRVEENRLWDVALFIAGFLSAALQFHNAPLFPLCNMVAHGLHAALLPRLADLFFRDRRPGIWAAGAAILLPAPRFFPHPEGIFCALGLMLFCLVTDRRLCRGGAGGALFTGLFAGLLALLNGVCMVVCGLWLLYLLSRRRIAFAAQSVPLIALAFLAALAPWIRGNHQNWHALLLDMFLVFITVGAFLGSALMARRGTPIAMLLAAVPVAYPVLYDSAQIDAPYGAPIFWVSLLGAGFLLSSAAAAVHRRPVAPLDVIIPPLHLLE
jgi:hypothetical protein